jgi:Spy/CpxP family protein refolding chaperone
MHLHQKLLISLFSLAIILPAAYGKALPQNDPSGPNVAAQSQAPPNGPRNPGLGDNGRREGWGEGWGGGRGGDGARPGGRTRMRGARGRGFMLDRILENPEFRQRLGITVDQAAKIHQQTIDFRKAEIRGRADLQIERLELRELLAADSPDRAAIDQKLQKISSERLAQEKSAIDYRLAMRSALTADQWQKLQKMREEFRRRSSGKGYGGAQGGRRRRPSQGAPPAAPNPPGEN